jgi:glycosyltransferase involved in cell wall biosynthesis
MPHRKFQILFNVCADAENYNAQSLNAREIALRLDPERFHSTLFFERSPDERLLRSSIRLVKVPARHRTIRVLCEMLGAYDAILYMDLSPASYAYLHLPKVMRRSTRTVLSIEGTRGNLDDVSMTIRRYADYIVRHSDVRVAISEFVAHDSEAFNGMRADCVIPVGVDTQVFHPPTVRVNEVPTVLFVGHLIQRKGPHLVIEAAQQFPEACFRLVGSSRGQFGEDLRRKCETLPNVRLELPMPQAQLAEVMRESDLLLHPSRVEGVPKVTLEGAATGLPCIVFDDYQTPSVLDGLTGFQVKAFDEMLVRLKLLIADRALRQKMGTAAVTHARAFDWTHVVGRWAEVVEHLVQQG